MSLLPAGYKRLEYIESNGTQHVDTGFKPNNNTRVVMDFKPTEAYSSMNAYFGARDTSTSSTAPNQYVLWNNGAKALRSDYFKTNVSLTIENLLTRKIADKNKNVTTVDGVSATNTANTGQCSYNMLLFAVNNAGTPDFKTKIQLYSCQIYDNDTLVRNFLPCENASGVVGLYDTVGGAFYDNDGTGSFVAGPEWSFTELEYIESTGAQWIGTGLLPNGNTRLLLEIEVTTPGTSFLFGSRHNSSANSTSNSFSMPQIDGASLRTDYGSSEAAISVSPLQRLAIDKDKNNTTVNGITVTSPVQTFQSSYELVLFAINTANTKSAYTSAKLHSCQVYDNGNLVRDYIPVKLYDGSVGLLDELTEVFYGNAGTGAFIAGPEVEIPPAQQIPPTPQNLHVSYAYGSSIRIEWEEAVDAEYYNVYRDGVLVSQVTTTSYTDSGLAEHAEHTYAVSAANSLGESESTSITAILTEFKLITDRSAADVQYVSGLALKAHKMTDAELSAWISGLKGAYNASDLNRVEGAVLYVVERLRIAGWYVKLDTKTDWKFSDFPTVAEMDRYLSNIRKLRAALPAGLPVVPADADKFTYSEANDIEILLESLDAAVTNIMANVFYSNELYSGEVQ